eukprot:1157728-Pelagomonas_calceolata.AAC.2
MGPCTTPLQVGDASNGTMGRRGECNSGQEMCNQQRVSFMGPELAWRNIMWAAKTRHANWNTGTHTTVTHI